ncbi:MAG: phenylalanine--tRNA ligase subunit alpha [Candidatus Nanopelagicales bacterium]
MSAPNKNFDPVMPAALDPANLQEAVDAALAAIAAAADLAALKQARIDHAGDRSPLALANREIAALPPSAKAASGKAVGAARGQVNQALKAREADLKQAERERILTAERVDVTMVNDREPIGARHPIHTISEHIADAFVSIGYGVVEGPELESEWFNFDALNIGRDHPARTMQDTFFVGAPDSGAVLRTHTSPLQIRTLLDQPPPVYVVCPGRVYRTDELDATHTPVFHQVEGLAVDKGLSMVDLKSTLDWFASTMFGEGIVTRLRPSYFPFTEPSAEVDLECFACRGESVGDPDRSCRTCSSEGWIEWGGCGMVNPRVLQSCGIDPDVYTGFAFGMGIERTLMFRHGITDMRDLVEGDVRFTAAFGMDS